MRVQASVTLLAAALASGCGDTLVDHGGGRFVNALACQGTPASCGAAGACVDCTATFTPPANAAAACNAAATCDYACNPGWLRCSAGCCLTAAVTAGAAHTCAIVSASGALPGELRCWGSNDRGQLGVGIGDTQDRLVPTAVLGMGSGVTRVAAGAQHTCAVNGGTLYCWGANGAGGVRDGRLGVTSVADQYETPQSVSLANVTALAPGELHTCVLAGTSVYCWGANALGQVGNGTFTSPVIWQSTPLPPATVTGALEVVSGRSHTCARLGAGVVQCWGANDWGQLGNGATPLPASPQARPVAVITLPVSKALAAGAHHGCAIDATATPLLWCWGENTSGQLGRGSTGGAFSVPASATDLQSLQPAAAAGGRAHTCAVKPADVNGIKCVGDNTFGQLGVPGAVTKADVSIGLGATAIAAGDDHGCAVATDGSLFCWGANTRGQVGNGSTATSVTPPALVSGR